MTQSNNDLSCCALSSTPLTKKSGYQLFHAPEINRTEADCMFEIIDLYKHILYEGVKEREDAELVKHNPIACGYILSSKRPKK